MSKRPFITDYFPRKKPNLEMEQLAGAVASAAVNRIASSMMGGDDDGYPDVDQSNGSRRSVLRTVRGGRKRFSPMKLLKSTFNYTEQQLGVRTADGDGWLYKHPVSEFNPGTGGYTSIMLDSALDCTPMHCYDLSYFCGTVEDNQTVWPVQGSSGRNYDINARMWIWSNGNRWQPVPNRRWYINDPRTMVQAENPSVKVYRKGIDIRYMLYGTTKMPTEFDVRVIKITDPKMCPDFASTLVATGQQQYELTEIQQNWQNLVRAYTTNPLLKGVEPGPEPVKRWFKTVAKQRVRIGEQTPDVDSVPCYQGSIRVKINEAQNYAWTGKGFAAEVGDAAYDAVPNVDADQTANDNFMYKPYYTSRYYLLIRALCPVDNGLVAPSNGDGLPGVSFAAPWDRPGTTVGGAPTPTIEYCPSYDLICRTTWMTVNAN